MENAYLIKRRQLKQGVIEKDPPKEKKPIARQSEKAKAQAADEKKLFAADKDFYADIWNSSPHICQCGCKAKLGKEPLTLFFHHLLPKSQYPEFRHTPENIMILSPDCHSQVEVDIDKRPAVKARRDEVYKLLIG